jgi:hypothetical protein
MTTEEQHRKRHIELHHALDELVADWIVHQPAGKLLSTTSIMELMQWSHRQTQKPDLIPGWTGDLDVPSLRQ